MYAYLLLGDGVLCLSSYFMSYFHIVCYCYTMFGILNVVLGAQLGYVNGTVHVFRSDSVLGIYTFVYIIIKKCLDDIYTLYIVRLTE